MAPSGLEELLAEGRAKFVAFVLARVGDPELAEDIVQDSLLKAVRSADELRERDRLVPWFYQVLRNAIIDAYRRKDVQRRHVVQELPEDLTEPSPDDIATLCACFRALLPTLKPEYREVIDLLDLQGRESASVAAALGVSPNNLKVRRHRARQALRQRLEETCRVCAEGHCLDCTCGSAAPASEADHTAAL